MPIETPETFIERNGEGLQHEIESLAEFIRDNYGDEQNPDGALAVLRIFKDMTPEQWRESARRFGLQDWLALPLNQEDFPLLDHLQDIIEELTYQGDHDPMTGLLNRRAFEVRVRSEIERAKRGKHPVTLAIIDLDDFKAINDTYGHPTGDEVLHTLAKTLVDITRRYDVPARIGGEEFALFLPDAGVVKAKATVNRVIESVRDYTFTAPDGTDFSVTCSVGVACWKAKAVHLTPDLYGIADQALYEAKNAGKNRMQMSIVPEHPATRPDSRVRSAEKRFLFTGS